MTARPHPCPAQAPVWGVGAWSCAQPGRDSECPCPAWLLGACCPAVPPPPSLSLTCPPGSLLPCGPPAPIPVLDLPSRWPWPPAPALAPCGRAGGRGFEVGGGPRYILQLGAGPTAVDGATPSLRAAACPHGLLAPREHSAAGRHPSPQACPHLRGHRTQRPGQLGLCLAPADPEPDWVARGPV